ncbi:hypothetical protein B0H13DRAFT_2051024 [Mycena leptocephala]|nr:hypothetical protein B0H13DRAFT_2051024 [Mycena leptocephala]
MEFQNYMYAPSLIKSDAAQFLDLNWIEVLALRKFLEQKISVMRTSSRFSSTIPQSDAMGMCMVFYLFSCLLVFALDTDDRGPDEGGTHAYAMFFSFSRIIFSRRGYIRPFVMIQNHS